MRLSESSERVLFDTTIHLPMTVPTTRSYSYERRSPAIIDDLLVLVIIRLVLLNLIVHHKDPEVCFGTEKDGWTWSKFWDSLISKFAEKGRPETEQSCPRGRPPRSTIRSTSVIATFDFFLTPQEGSRRKAKLTREMSKIEHRLIHQDDCAWSHKRSGSIRFEDFVTATRTMTPRLYRHSRNSTLSLS